MTTPSTLVLLVATLTAVTKAENFFIQAQYRTNKCDGATVNLFDSQPQSYCHFDGSNYSFWNCTTGEPIVYNCGQDTTCTTCAATRLTFNSTQCSEYPIPGTYSGIWARRYCATTLVPFPGVSFNLARTYASQADCTAANTAKLRKVAGEAVYCANSTASNTSAIRKCIVAANGDVSSEQSVCLSTLTCASCTVVLNTPGRKCRMITSAEYVTDVCSSDSPTPGTTSVSGSTTSNVNSQTSSDASATASVSASATASASGSASASASASATGSATASAIADPTPVTAAANLLAVVSTTTILAITFMV
jgi:hypothetical protein